MMVVVRADNVTLLGALGVVLIQVVIRHSWSGPVQSVPLTKYLIIFFCLYRRHLSYFASCCDALFLRSLCFFCAFPWKMTGRPSPPPSPPVIGVPGFWFRIGLVNAF
ncbi:hypothetical protein B0T17DRAFT_19662 [Bombardia bombarda]|uniref:Uncharacterized protein n=1 Tax=Bombardia bombarda TaxID=252184 RepID=A0AA39XJM7_9PEZI|nr:hypothetical protein B0T17DRAFT_19662 [Bombardia bombarda]